MDADYAPLESGLSGPPRKPTVGSFQGGDGGEKTGTIQGSIFNLANTILGSGTLAMSYACFNSGILLFAVLVGGTAYAAHLAVITLFQAVECSGHLVHGELNYPSLGKALYGRKGELVASWSVTLQQLGACIAYVVIIADVLQPILGLSGLDFFCHRYAIQLLVLYMVIFPLCLMRSMESLKYTSFAALFFIASFVFTILIYGMYVLANPSQRDVAPVDKVVCGESTLSGWTQPGSAIGWGPHGSDFLKALPVICFAFLCHQNTFPIYAELPNASLDKMAIISKTSMTICFLVYFLAGLFGYLIFLDATDADLLGNFSVQDSVIADVMDGVRIGFGFALIFSFPVVVWEARHNLQDLLFGHDLEFDLKRHVLLNLGIITGTTVVGILAPGIEDVLGLVGSTCSPLMMFILPAAFYLEAGPGDWTAPNKRVAVGLLAWGCILIPVTVTEWIVSV